MENIIKIIKEVDKRIKKRYRYSCGLSEEKDLKSFDSNLFFESTDGQNSELFSELRKEGFEIVGYHSHYNWKIKKDGYSVEYLEGDIYIRKII